MSERGALFATGLTAIDVTVPIRPGMAVWPGDPAVEISPVLRMADGEEANVSRVAFSTHVGTHVDAPWHFVDNGPTLDEIPIERWIGPCVVVDIPDGTPAISSATLSAKAGLADTTFVILKTRSDAGPSPDADTFDPDFSALTRDGAQWLVEHGMQLVGIDTPSVEAASGDGEVHRILLRAGILIVEGLDLRGVSPGMYTLICLPLKLEGVDGAPARVVLVGNR